MIYFDNASTTRVSVAASEAALVCFRENFGNPSSLHRLGIEAEEKIEESAEIIADILGVSSDEIFFTSGGTEANNIAIRGAMKARKRNFTKFIYDSAEHESVIEVASRLSLDGFQVIGVAPTETGSADIEKIVEQVDDKTGLVSLMLINNETGSVTDVASAVKKIKAKNKDTLVHIDCVAAFCKTDINVKKIGADLITISGHKIHAPKGIGALYIKKGVRVIPVLVGSAQQKGIRPGTESVPLIASFGVAAKEANENKREVYEKAFEINEYLRRKLSEIEGVSINSPEGASPFVLNFSTNAVGSEIMLHFLEGHEIYVSAGSACAKGEKSHVLKGMKFGNREIETALRISLSEENNLEEAEKFISALKEGLSALQRSYK